MLVFGALSIGAAASGKPRTCSKLAKRTPQRGEWATVIQENGYQLCGGNASSSASPGATASHRENISPRICLTRLSSSSEIGTGAGKEFSRQKSVSSAFRPP